MKMKFLTPILGLTIATSVLSPLASCSCNNKELKVNINDVNGAGVTIDNTKVIKGQPFTGELNWQDEQDGEIEYIAIKIGKKILVQGKDFQVWKPNHLLEIYRGDLIIDDINITIEATSTIGFNKNINYNFGDDTTPEYVPILETKALKVKANKTYNFTVDMSKADYSISTAQYPAVAFCFGFTHTEVTDLDDEIISDIFDIQPKILSLKIDGIDFTEVDTSLMSDKTFVIAHDSEIDPVKGLIETWMVIIVYFNVSQQSKMEFSVSFDKDENDFYGVWIPKVGG